MKILSVQYKQGSEEQIFFINQSVYFKKGGEKDDISECES